MLNYVEGILLAIRNTRSLKNRDVAVVSLEILTKLVKLKKILSGKWYQV
jgi:hypothetical protein